MGRGVASFGTKRTRAGKERAVDEGRGRGGEEGNGRGGKLCLTPREAPPVSEFPTEFP